MSEEVKNVYKHLLMIAASCVGCCSDRSPNVQAVVVDLKGLRSESIVELASSIRKVFSLKSLPVLALSMGLTPAGEKELKDAGISHIINKPLRYSTLAVVLLETVGVPARAPMKKRNANANMLGGRKLLVVSLTRHHVTGQTFFFLGRGC